METIELFNENPNPAPKTMTKQEYRRSHAAPERQKAIRGFAIVGYVLCGFNIVIGMLGGAMLIALVEMGALLAVLLGAHLRKSKACAIAILVYSIANTVILLLNTGSFGGWLWIVVGVGLVDTFRRIDKDYKAEMTSKPSLEPDMFRTYDE